MEKKSNTEGKKVNKSRKEYIRAYRENLKLNSPDLHKATKLHNAIKMSVERAEWTEEERQRNRELSRIRMQKYRDRKKEREAAIPKKSGPLTKEEEEKLRIQREKWKLQKRKDRLKRSSEKERRIKEKDREPKKTLKETKKNPINNNDTTNSDDSEANLSPSSAAIRWIVSGVETRLPKVPRKYSAMVIKLEQESPPRKSTQLKKMDVKTTEDVSDITTSVCNASKSLSKRTKAKLKSRREFAKLKRRREFVMHMAKPLKKET